MKHSLLVAAGALVVATLLPAQQPTRPTLDGPWTFWRRQPNRSDFPLRVELQFRRDSVTVTGLNGLVLHGRTTASGVELTVKAADKKTDITVSARWVGDSLVGQGKQGSDTISFLWLARDHARPAASPTRQTVHPTEFFRVVSTAPKPLVHIWSGDTV